MLEPDRMRFVRVHRTVGVTVVALLALTVAACGNSGANSPNSTNPSTNANDAALLGPVARATGTPVKVGLITDGGTQQRVRGRGRSTGRGGDSCLAQSAHERACWPPDDARRLRRQPGSGHS